MDYFTQSSAQPGSGAQNTQNNAAAPAPAGTAAPMRRRPVGLPSYESLRAPSNIRIRRLPSGFGSALSRPTTQDGNQRAPSPVQDTTTAGRRRSMSAPQGYGADATPGEADDSRLDGPPPHMPAISESFPTTPNAEAMQSGQRGVARHSAAASSLTHVADAGQASHSAAGYGTQRSRAPSYLGRLRSNTSSTYFSRGDRPHHDEYDSDVIDLLDLIDPEVRTLGTLTNLQNSLFVPDLGGLLNRRPTYELSSRYDRTSSRPTTSEGDLKKRPRAGTHASRISQRPPQLDTIPQDRLEMDELGSPNSNGGKRRLSIGSNLSDSRYAVLPHGVSLDGWSEEDIEELNDHVRHLLHSRKEGFKRSWKGFKKYVSRPLGLFVFLYATSVTLFGMAWVFGLIGWIYVGSEDRQQYIIDIIDNILVALFALMGDGLAPFRAVDTYHMCFIAHYHHLTWKLREQKKLPNLVDRNDLPERHVDSAILEDAIDKEEMAEYSVLSPRQQKRLQYHQAKFSKSHTFYKPHETSTHHAFPLRLLVAVVTLLDFHSLFQIALGTCTWSIDYHVRPQSLTATILACSLTCNITAGILISVGDHKTRKKDVLERMFRQALTEQALKRMARTRERGALPLTVEPDQIESDLIGNAYTDVTGKEVGKEARSKSSPNSEDVVKDEPDTSRGGPAKAAKAAGESMSVM